MEPSAEPSAAAGTTVEPTMEPTAEPSATAGTTTEPTMEPTAEPSATAGTTTEPTIEPSVVSISNITESNSSVPLSTLYPTLEPTPAISSVPTTFAVGWGNFFNRTGKDISSFSNETFHGMKYPTAAPTTFNPTIMPTGSASNPYNATTDKCYFFGLVCNRDFEKMGMSFSPSSAPTGIPLVEPSNSTYAPTLHPSAAPLVASNSSSEIELLESSGITTKPTSDCYLFGFFCRVKQEPLSVSKPKEEPSLNSISPLRIANLQRKTNGRLRARI
jgi:hypothetical protein